MSDLRSSVRPVLHLIIWNVFANGVQQKAQNLARIRDNQRKLSP